MTVPRGCGDARRARRRRRAEPRHRGAVIGLAVALLIVTSSLEAQTRDSIPAPTTDSLHRLKPLSAFWRSLVIPGWGQAATKRWVTGATFVVWEGTCAMMTIKAQREVEYLRAAGAGNVKGKQQEKEDWLVLWIFNHLFAGAEAFVSGHLQDFPKDLELRAIPRGVSVSFPLPRP
jgi:hypothetical protein